MAKNTNLKDTEKILAKFDNSIEAIEKELRRIQSLKCRLKKQKRSSTYETEMTEILKYEQMLKESKQVLDPKDKPVTHYSQEDVDQLDYDQLVKAVRTIQSKKTLSRWLTTVEGDNDEFLEACKIEDMLQKRKSELKPLNEDQVRKTEIQKIVDILEEQPKLSQEHVLELLKKLL